MSVGCIIRVSGITAGAGAATTGAGEATAVAEPGADPVER